jgi:hypothetical protein
MRSDSVCAQGSEDSGGVVQVNVRDVVSALKATSKEDFRDVVKPFPENTPSPPHPTR